MSIQKLLTFTRDITRLLETHPGEEQILVDGSKLLATLVASDDWLPEIFAQPHPRYSLCRSTGSSFDHQLCLGTGTENAGT